ncbi:MAG: hypothetical protein JWP15_1090 [Alphaproteobacteria bacterium]|nr:hypothetical protein [Alphaproteobacteria bacterium]
MVNDPATFGAALSRNGARRFWGETAKPKGAFGLVMVDEKLMPKSKAASLRERADRCRVMAKEYHPSVGAPLIELATELEREAAILERYGVERRGKAMFG